MSCSRSSYRWMEDILDLLYERFSDTEARALLRDEQARDRALDELAPALEQRGSPAGALRSPEGRRLFLAVVTLRLKLPADEAREKVRWNIAVREQQR